LGLPPKKTCVVSNLIDVKHFNREKFEGAFFNLGVMGVVPLRKRLDLALDTLELLKKRDDRYTLHVKGAHPASYQWVWRDTKEREYYLMQWERINAAEWGNSVVFDPQGDDVADWFRCVGFILSPSDFESFHMSVSEGMSSGTLPIIWDWEGAEKIHPQRFIVSSPQEAADMIEELRRSGNLEQLRDEVREYVRRKFDLRVVRDRWIELLSVSE
jgi:glycosyltransferase involved in cell wall biosynthesis